MVGVRRGRVLSFDFGSIGPIRKDRTGLSISPRSVRLVDVRSRGVAAMREDGDMPKYLMLIVESEPAYERPAKPTSTM